MDDRRRGPFRLLSLLAVTALLVGGLAAAVTPASAASKWKRAWADEFNTPAGVSPSPKKWVFDLGGEPQWGNEEWQSYTRSPRNVSTDGRGHLAITARREKEPLGPCPVGSCDITSGRITTKGRFSQTYGRFAARMKLPAGQAIWPAFWMMGRNIDRVGWPNNGEIDIMELLGNDPGTVYGTAHGPGFVNAGIGGSGGLPGGAPITGHWHVFSVDWGPRKLRWRIDGRPFFQLRRSSLKDGQRWVFDHPHYLLLNLAVGGQWPGKPDATTPFPSTMLVDWVRAFRAR